MEIRERISCPSRGIIQKCEPHERSSCAPQFGKRSHEETLHQERCARKAAWDLAKFFYLQPQECRESYVSLSCWNKGGAGAYFKIPRGTRIRACFWSISAHAEQTGFELRGTGDSAEIQDLPQWWQRPMGEWVSGQKPRLPKEGKTIVCKTDNFVPLFVPGLSTSSGSNSSSTLALQDLSSTRSSSRAKWRTCPTKVVRVTLRNPKEKEKEGWQSRFGRPFARFSWVVGGVHRQSRGHRNASARTHLSGLRFGTSFESGIKIKEAQFLYSLPERPKLRSLCGNLNDKGSLQKTHWRSSTSSRMFGDLITADVKVLNEGCDQETITVTSSLFKILPRKTKTSQETERSLLKFLEPSHKPKFI